MEARRSIKLMLSRESYLATRLDHIDTEYLRELAAAEQLYNTIDTYLSASGDDHNAEGEVPKSIMVSARWEMVVKRRYEPEANLSNRCGAPMEEFTSLTFYPTRDNPVSEMTGPMLELLISRNGVVDPNTAELLTAHQILSLHSDMTQLFAEESPTE